MFFATSPSLLMLCIAGGIRNAGGYVWAYNANAYFEHENIDPDTIATYMLWIPLVGGSLGASFGGLIADKVLKDRGSSARVWVLVFSNLVAAPFAAGALILPKPWNFLSLIPSNVFGEMWVGVTLAIVNDLVPSRMRVLATSVYFFIISNIGGNMPQAVTPVRNEVGYKWALLWLFPGAYVIAAVAFFLTLLSLNRDVKKKQELEEEQPLISNFGASLIDEEYGSLSNKEAQNAPMNSMVGSSYQPLAKDD